MRMSQPAAFSEDFIVPCAGSLDADCPIWDHVVQLFVCCEDPEGRTSQCDKCDVTPWMSMTADGEPPPA